VAVKRRGCGAGGVPRERDAGLLPGFAIAAAEADVVVLIGVGVVVGGGGIGVDFNGVLAGEADGVVVAKVIRNRGGGGR